MKGSARLLWLVAIIASTAVATSIAFLVARPCKLTDGVARLSACLIVVPALGYLLFSWRGLGRPVVHSFVRAALLALLLFVVVGTLGPNLMGAVPRARQVRAMAQLRSLAGTLDPQLKGHTLLTGERLGPTDPWGHPIRIVTRPDRYFIISFGECGEPDLTSLNRSEYIPGPTTDYSADIVYSNGEFVRYPEGVQR